jgi:hypothetical protein
MLSRAFSNGFSLLASIVIEIIVMGSVIARSQRARWDRPRIQYSDFFYRHVEGLKKLQKTINLVVKYYVGIEL